MVQNGLDKQAGIVGGFLVGIAQEHGAAVDLACGKLDVGQLEGLHLRPVVDDVLEVLGIDRKLSKELPVLFERREVFFLFVFFASFFDQSVGLQDTSDGVMGTGQVMFALEAFGSHEGVLFSQPDDLLFERWGDFMGAGQRDPRQFIESGQPFLLIAHQPFPHGFGGGIEGSGGGLDAVLLSKAYHPQPTFELVSVAFHAYNLIIVAKRFYVHTRPFVKVVFLWRATHFIQGSF